MKKNRAKSKLILGLSCVIVVMSSVSCTSGGTQSGTDMLDSVHPTIAKERLFFDDMSQIPVQGVDKSFIIRLHNDYSRQFSLQSVDVIDPISNKIVNDLANVKSDMCSIVPANNSCSLNMIPRLKKSGSFILQAKLVGSTGEIITVKQLVRLSDKISSSSGILFDNDLATVSAPNGVYHMAFPVVLDAQFDELKATNGNVICSGGFQQGSSCTYFVDGKALADNTLVETKLEGYLNGALVSSRSFTTRAITASLANLLISQPADINIGENELSGTSVVTLYNNGNLEATSVRPKVNGAGLSIINGCNTVSLVPGASCTFTVQAQGEVNGTGSVGAGYASGASTGLDVSTNIVYTKANIPAKLELGSVAGNLSNSFVGIPAIEYLVLSNTGTRKITAINYKLDKTTEFSFAGAGSGSISACGASGSLELAPAEKCALKVTYIPTAATTGSLSYKLSVAGKYTNSNSLDASILSDLSRPYSALSAANVLALNADSFNLIVQTNQSKARDLEVTNTSPFDATLGTLALDPAVTGLNITGDPTAGTKCANNGILSNGGGKCSIAVTYAPNAVTTNEISTKVVIPVTKIGSTVTPANTKREANVTVRAVTSLLAANITVAITAPSPLPSGVNNSMANGYNLLGLPGNSLKLTYTFTAEAGKGDAASFNVSSAGLPVGAQIITAETDCPVGATVGSLNAGLNCQVVVETPRQSLISNGMLTTGQVKIKLPYSWQDVAAGGSMQVNKFETAEQTINITTDWLSSLNVTGGPFITSGDLAQSTITTSFADVVVGSGLQYPLMVTGTINGNVNPADCNIEVGIKTCSMELSIPATAPASNYYVDVLVSDSTPAPNTRFYRKSVLVTKS